MSQHIKYRVGAIPAEHLNTYDITIMELNQMFDQYAWHSRRVEVQGMTLPHQQRDSEELIAIMVKVRTASKWDVSRIIKLLVEGRMTDGSG